MTISILTHEITFSKHLWMEKEDFMEEPIPKYKRMYPGNEVRLKGTYLVTCTGCVKDENGEFVEVLCEYDPESRGGNPADGRKVKWNWKENNKKDDKEKTKGRGRTA